ncbi:FxSxx-COOH cyclophane-containing RiPP peptide [Streptomyces sp. DH24]|uniref:FxSxx-COOH cyclophane-containing RiPP peptide n=1 Tax=Streptomyces sp. DH24 TaxID=3040123 RepID=UPI002441D4E4|nr:FxSxx-COOH cyclophane-containing RiPP peptide [Streptomyces sp. DH24]MDG9716560.1 FxSxx-COOH protein [Streptomyces sp. DH24]
MGTADGFSRDPAFDGSDEPLPDLLTLDLAELGSIDHPVLREVLGELRARAAEPSEMLWGFDNSF